MGGKHRSWKKSYRFAFSKSCLIFHGKLGIVDPIQLSLQVLEDEISHDWLKVSDWHSRSWGSSAGWILHQPWKHPPTQIGEWSWRNWRSEAKEAGRLCKLRQLYNLVLQAQADHEEKKQSELAQINKVFYCELCDKQYHKATEWDIHLSSYDHHHKKVRAQYLFCFWGIQRFQEMKKSLNSLSKSDREKKQKAREEKELKQL